MREENVEARENGKLKEVEENKEWDVEKKDEKSGEKNEGKNGEKNAEKDVERKDGKKEVVLLVNVKAVEEKNVEKWNAESIRTVVETIGFCC